MTQLRPVGPAFGPALFAGNILSVAVDPATGDPIVVHAYERAVGVWRVHDGAATPLALGPAAVGLPPAFEVDAIRAWTRRDGRIGAMFFTGSMQPRTACVEIALGGTRIERIRGPEVVSRTARSASYDPVRDALVALDAAVEADVATLVANELSGQTGRTATARLRTPGRERSAQVRATCWSTSLSRVVALVELTYEPSTRQPSIWQLVAWDGAEAVVLGSAGFLSALQYPLTWLADGVVAGADVVVLAVVNGQNPNWATFSGGACSEPTTLPSVSWASLAADPTRRTLWIAGCASGAAPAVVAVLTASGVSNACAAPAQPIAALAGERAAYFFGHDGAVALGAGGARQKIPMQESGRYFAMHDDVAFTVDFEGQVRRFDSAGAPMLVGQKIGTPMSLNAMFGEPRDGTLHAFGWRPAGRKVEKVHARFDGAGWTELAAPQSAGGAPMFATDAGDGRLVVVHPDHQKYNPSLTEWFDGTAWRGEPFGIGPGFKPLDTRDLARGVRALGHDAKTGHVVMVAVGTKGPMLAVYARDGYWKIVAELGPVGPGTTSVGYPAALFAVRGCDRRVVMYGAANDGSAAVWCHEAEIGALLDALPRPGQIPAPRADVAPLDSYALVSTEDGAKKYWTLRVEGASYTAAWGRRGAAKGQSKTFTARTAEKARADAMKKLDEKLAEGYRPVPEGPDVARTGKRTAWPFEGSGEPRGDALGGPGVAAGPACAVCAKPMSLVVRFSRHPERLPLRRHAGLAVWVCTSAGCRPWESGGGANAAQLLDDPGAAAVLKGAQGLAFAAPIAESEPDSEGESTAGAETKLGGFAAWIQEPASPNCDECGDAMAFVAQITDDTCGHNFGDQGTGYVFLCPRECSAAFLTQSA